MPDLNELFESKRKKVSLEKKKVGVFSTSVEYKWDNNVQNFSPEDYHYHEVRKRIANVCYMCMNKVLVSRYKKVTFPIVSYPELVEIISGATRE